MYRLLPGSIVLSFCGTSRGALDSMLLLSGSAIAGRAALKALTPGFPRDDPADPPREPVHPFPTDVPTPAPTDVPVANPRDVPAPEPGSIPPGAKPRPDEKNPKPRGVP